MQGIRIIRNRRNLGYGGGCNSGIKSALAEGAHFVWLLNPDVMVEPNTLAGLLETMKSDDRIGVAGPKCVFEDMPWVIRNAGYFVEPEKGCKIRRHGLWKNNGHRYNESPMNVDFLSGACLLIRKKTLEEIGLLAERYFLYWEDVEFCHRAISGEWKVVVNNEVMVFHGKKAEVKQKAANYYHYFFTRNHLNFVKEHHPKVLYKALGISISKIVRLFVEKGGYRGFARLHAAGTSVMGLIDGLLFSAGKRSYEVVFSEEGPRRALNGRHERPGCRGFLKEIISGSVF